MSDLATHSLTHTARTETLPPADGAKGDAKTQALKGRSATLDVGALSRLLGQDTKTSTNGAPQQGIAARSARSDAENPGPQRIAQTSHDGKPDVEVFGKGGVAAKGAEPAYANAKAHEQEPQYANAGFARGDIESGYSVLKKESDYSPLENPIYESADKTGSKKRESDYSAVKNPVYLSADKTGSRATGRAGEDPYLTPRSNAGSRGTFRPLSDRMASIGDAPPPRLERLKAAVQKLFVAVKSLISRTALVRSRPTSQPSRVAQGAILAGGGESWRNPTLARRTLPQTPQTPPQRAGAAPSGYESGVQGVRSDTLASQSPIFVELSATERYEERLRTDMRNLGDADKAAVRHSAGEIDRITSTAETLDIELTDQQALQVAQHRHDIALVLENHIREQGGSA